MNRYKYIKRGSVFATFFSLFCFTMYATETVKFVGTEGNNAGVRILKNDDKWSEEGVVDKHYSQEKIKRSQIRDKANTMTCTFRNAKGRFCTY